jgi:CRP-like cAMP-binding protein
MIGSSTITEADLLAATQVPLFAELPPAAVADLLRGATVRSFAETTLLFSAGDRADAFYLVIEGAVRLFFLNRDGSETTIEIVGATTAFAEAAMFASGHYPVNAEAMEGCRLLRVDARVFLRQLHCDRSLALKMLASLGRWQLHLMGELWQLKAQTPAQRLAWYLVSLTDGGQGPAVVRLPYPKNLIASRIGITPESLSRALTRLSGIGVDTHGDEVTIHDVAALKQFGGF